MATASKTPVNRPHISEPGDDVKYARNWQPGAKFDPETGAPQEIVTDAVFEGMSHADAVAHLGIELPPGYKLILTDVTFHHSRTKYSWTRAEQGEDAVTQPNENRRVQWKFRVVWEGKLTDLVPLEEITRMMMSQAKPVRHPSSRRKKVRDAFVIATSDRQLQKQDRLGGTRELLRRERYLQNEVLAILKEREKPYDEIFILDGGDSFEGFQNLVKQKVNNDLGTASALSAVIAIAVSWGRMVAPYTKEVIFAVPPSNHCQPGRQAGESYEQPGEDLAVFCYKQAVEILSAMGINARIETAHYLRSTIYFEIAGHKVSLAHGHIGSADRARMIEKLAGDGHEMAYTEVVFEGHRHSFSTQKVGRTIDKLQRWHVVLDAMENGSTYFSDANGRTSIPSLCTWEFIEGVPFHPANGRAIVFPAELVEEKPSEWWTSNLDGLKALA